MSSFSHEHSSPAEYRSHLVDALRGLTGTQVWVEGTGGGCEAIFVGPLDNGAHLQITDGDAGVPSSAECRSCREYGFDPECSHDGRGWVVNVAPHGPDVECDACGDCSYPHVADEQAPRTTDGLLPVVARALRGERD